MSLLLLGACQIQESGAEGKPPVAAPAKTKMSFKVGDAVDGLWTDGRYWEATIAAVNKNGTYDVKWTDGSVEKLAAGKLRAAIEGGPYKPGDRVEAAGSDGAFSPGTILGVADDGSYNGVSDDGGTMDKLVSKKLRPSPAKPLKAGSPVWGKWTDGAWYAGKIAALNKDGTFKVDYVDGDSSPALTTAQIGWRQVASSGGGTATTGNCPGPGFTRRCNGVCTKIQDDNNNCGGCGETCREGYHCDGLFCRDSEGHVGGSYKK